MLVATGVELECMFEGVSIILVRSIYVVSTASVIKSRARGTQSRGIASALLDCSALPTSKIRLCHDLCQRFSNSSERASRCANFKREL